MEADEAGIKMLEKEVLENADFFTDGSRKAAEKYLRSKFFPKELRAKLWPMLIENKHRVNKKLYKAYSDVVDKKLKEFDSYGKDEY